MKLKLKKFSVTSLTNYIKTSLETDIFLANVDVEGEVSNVRYHSNGNIYFSLKDDSCKINCIMFNHDSENLEFEIKDGEKVSVGGKISVYPREGNYQIICYIIERQGLGELYKEFEAIRDKLKSKGYFDESNKKPIPKVCFNIGVITSATGSVIRDILNVHSRKNKFVNIKVFNSLVQGNEAYKDIIQGIRYFNIENNVDVIIIARGGGSFEDLWVFNNEVLADEIYKSKIPTVSGVGHETDFTICDFVSDLRVSTPTAAAEICIPDIESILISIDNYKNDLDISVKKHLEILKNRILENKIKINSYSPVNFLRDKKITLNNLFVRLNSTFKKNISDYKNMLSNFKISLERNNFSEILNKGFVLVRSENLNFIKSKEHIKDSQKIALIFGDGEVEGTFILKEGNEGE